MAAVDLVDCVSFVYYSVIVIVAFWSLNIGIYKEEVEKRYINAKHFDKRRRRLHNRDNIARRRRARS